MGVFKDRRHGHETKHQKDQELEFKAVARRNKLLGLWAAEKLGKHGDAAQKYATEVIHADLDEPGDDDVVRKVMTDFAAHGVKVPESDVRAQLKILLEEARRQLKHHH